MLLLHFSDKPCIAYTSAVPHTYTGEMEHPEAVHAVQDVCADELYLPCTSKRWSANSSRTIPFVVRAVLYLPQNQESEVFTGA
jgi:hypothetical protein